MSSSVAVGFVIAVVSAFFNGVFPAWRKLCREEADDVVFNGLVGLGACLSSLIVPLLWGEAYELQLAAMLGGVVFVCATLCTFIAVPKLGLSVACATWSCTAMLVSFLWGAVGPGGISATVASWPLSLLALLCLATGATVIVAAEALAKLLFGASKALLPVAAADVAAADVAVAEPGEAPGAGGRLVGLFFAVATGVFGGSVLVPMHFVTVERQIQTVLSFGLGAGAMALLTTLAYWKIVARRPGLPCVQGRTLLAGILAGSTWNAGNICQIVVQSDPINLSLGIAYPIGQCGMLFAGLLGIFVFGEIKGKAILLFWSGVAVLAVGVVLLGLNGPGA